MDGESPVSLAGSVPALTTCAGSKQKSGAGEREAKSKPSSSARWKLIVMMGNPLPKAVALRVERNMDLLAVCNYVFLSVCV